MPVRKWYTKHSFMKQNKQKRHNGRLTWQASGPIRQVGLNILVCKKSSSRKQEHRRRHKQGRKADDVPGQWVYLL